MIGRATAAVFLAALALGGCGSSAVWETERAIVPVTYAPTENAVARHVGRLRRLALIATNFDYEPQGKFSEALGSFPNGDEVEIERRLGEALAQRALRFLADWRGYDVVDARGRAGDGENGHRVAAIVDWLARAPAGAEPPPEVAAAVTALARAREVDGLVVIKGWGRQVSGGEMLAVLGTASLAWPVLFAADKTRLRADIVEGARGRLVWRHVLTSKDATVLNVQSNEGPHSSKTIAEDLFAPLEPALPSVFAVPSLGRAPPG